MTAVTSPADMPVTIIGHPFAPIGRGEDLRTMYRACKAVGMNPSIVNAYEGGTDDADLQAELGPAIRPHTGGGMDVYCINGDEIEPILAHLGPRRRAARRSIVFPAWELPSYPAAWARQLERFDEVWTYSTFVHDAIAAAVSIPVHVVPPPIGVRLGRFLGRRSFGIPESAYAFLFAFDLRSYHHRKNPLGVLDAFARLVTARPGSDVVLVVKMAGGDVRAEAAEELLARLRSSSEQPGLGRLVILEQPLTDSETKNLVLCCDAFVSLHRSEGYGRFLGEAMYLGKPVIATAWSGNMQFMNEDVACLVRAGLVPVRAGEYPYWNDQVWADPDIEEAAQCMIRLVDDPGWGRRLGERASRHLRSRFSYRAVGLDYLNRRNEIVASPAAAGRASA
jgi:glycosyltransferase involved in cell wall biosynthesis